MTQKMSVRKFFFIKSTFLGYTYLYQDDISFCCSQKGSMHGRHDLPTVVLIDSGVNSIDTSGVNKESR